MKQYSKELYTREVLLKTAYAFTNSMYIHLDVDDQNYLVTLTSKENVVESEMYAKFENELIAQETRRLIAKKTKNIREMIVARALSSTMIHQNIENIQENIEDDYDADDILKDWFDTDE